MRDNRSLKSAFQRPSQQLKVSIILSSLLSILFCAFVVANLKFLQNQVVEMATDAHVLPATIDNLNRSFTIAMVVTGLFAIVSIVCGLMIGLTLMSRLFGPVVPIRRLIASYAQGDYKARAFLRKNDELKDVMQDLNLLGASLEQRHGLDQKI